MLKKTALSLKSVYKNMTYKVIDTVDINGYLADIKLDKEKLMISYVCNGKRIRNGELVSNKDELEQAKIRLIKWAKTIGINEKH